MINEKNIIVPLSSFIASNETAVKEKFKNLIGTMDGHLTMDVMDTVFSRMFSGNDNKADPKIAARHEQLATDALTATSTIIQYNLAELNTENFIAKLQKALSLSDYDKMGGCNKENLKHAWKLLIEWNKDSTNKFNDLIKLTVEDKSIYLVADINELHAEKIIELLKQNFSKDWNLPDTNEKNKPIKISNNFYLCPSYNYNALIESPANAFPSNLFKSSKPHLISEVIKYLSNKDILLVSDNEKEKSIAEKLVSKVSSLTDFYSALESTLSSNATAICDGESTNVRELNFRS